MGRSAIRPLVGGLLGATLLALSACGADRAGSVAIGGAPPAPLATTPSSSGVVFVPLDSPTPGASAGSTPTGVPGSPGTSTAPAGTASGSTTGRPPSSTGGSTGTGGGSTPSGGTGSTGATGTGGSGSTGGGSAGGSGTPTPPPGGGPTSGPPQSQASLTVTALHTADTGQRWCQRVTLGIANSGDRAASGGTVTFATHVIGSLGVDWWTYQTSQPLAAPVAGHSSVNESWTVCLDSWRVPAGMHMETRAASLG